MKGWHVAPRSAAPEPPEYAVDEFSDNITAYVRAFDGDLKLVCVETLD